MRWELGWDPAITGHIGERLPFPGRRYVKGLGKVFRYRTYYID